MITICWEPVLEPRNNHNVYLPPGRDKFFVEAWDGDIWVDSLSFNADQARRLIESLLYGLKQLQEQSS